MLRVNADRRRQTADDGQRTAVGGRRPHRPAQTGSAVVLLLALCLPALWPMLSVTFWASHDGLHHIFRIANFDAAIRSGVLFPRWADQLGFGYGFPVTHYYAPFAYYLAEAFHFVGAGFLDSIKLTYVLGFVATALCMYRLARDVVAPRAALLAAIVYAYYPYHVADMYMRGALTEFLALALLPLIAWSARRIVQSPESKVQRPKYVMALAVALGALILTHNLTAFLFLPFLMLYVALVGNWRLEVGSWRLGFGLWALGFGILFAFALTAFYWLPALTEVSWIRAGQVSGSVDDLPTLLTPLTQFVSNATLQLYVPDAPAALQHPLGLVVAGLSAAALLVGIARRAQLTRAQRREWLAWIVIAAAAAFAMLDLSAPLWSSLRPLAFVQFPYRLHAVLSLALAMVIGLGAESIFGRMTNDERRTQGIPSFVVGLSSLALIVSALGALNVTSQALPGHKEPISESQVNLAGMSEYDYQTALWARLYGGPWLLEYMPAWVTAAREEFFLPNSHPALRGYTGEGNAPVIAVRRYDPQRRELSVQNAAPFRLSFHTFYFPAWQVRVDGAPLPTFPVGSLGLVGADVPAGEHAVTLTMEATPLQHVGEWLSVLSLFVVATLVARTQLKSSLRLRARDALCALFIVTIFFVGWRSLEVRTAAAPQPVAATFDDQINLVGYAAAHEVVQRGDTLDLTLYWFALKAPNEDFKVFIHLDPSAALPSTALGTGKAGGIDGRAGQVDAQPGFNFSPTTRWQPGELIADHYRLKISAAAKPGAYELFTGLYRQQPLQNLSVTSTQAAPGDRVRLGTIEIQ